MPTIAKAALAAIALAVLATPAMANWKHHKHDCGWGRHHHKRC